MSEPNRILLSGSTTDGLLLSDQSGVLLLSPLHHVMDFDEFDIPLDFVATGAAEAIVPPTLDHSNAGAPHLHSQPLAPRAFVRHASKGSKWPWQKRPKGILRGH